MVSSSPSSSISPLDSKLTYDRNDYGRTSNYAMYFQNSRYYQEQNFTSVAAELNSRFLEGRLTNTLRYTYSHQYEPRSYDGGIFPTVDILEPTDKGVSALYASFGLDPFTEGNLREVSTHIVTDEIGYTIGKNHLVAGLQFEHNLTTNGYLQGGAGYYVYESWDDFKNNKKPLAFRIAHGNNDDLAQAYPSFTHMQYSIYLQDEINFSERFKATVGLRFEVPVYPSISDNENKDFTRAFADYGGYKTSDMPKARLSVAPRVGFNWDMTGERKYILFLSGFLPAQPGDMVTPEGEIVGHHDGLMYYTLGQRKGLGIGGRGDGRSWFVIDKDLEHNRLIVCQGGDDSHLFTNVLHASQMTFIAGEAPAQSFECTA